jgi:Ca-activated chloride channel homolog
MHDITFAHKGFFFLFLLIPAMVAWYILRQNRNPINIKLSSFVGFRNNRKSYKNYLKHIPFIFRMLAFALMVAILARPQSSASGTNVTSEGIDIELVLDVSGSMMSEDFSPNRVGAAKQVAEDFIDGRPNDRIGLVVFAAEAMSSCPLTIDHSILKTIFSGIKIGVVDDSRTAIGEGLATGVARIKDSKSKSKIIILMTDGVNNAGKVSPLDAGIIANTFGVRVYTIGVGTNGVAPFPVQTPMGIRYQNEKVEIDEDLLKQISDETGGKYFRATDNTKLKTIYAEIDKMEKSKVELTEFKKYTEEYFYFALAAGLLLLIEILLRYTLLRSLP